MRKRLAQEYRNRPMPVDEFFNRMDGTLYDMKLLKGFNMVSMEDVEEWPHYFPSRFTRYERSRE